MVVDHGQAIRDQTSNPEINIREITHVVKFLRRMASLVGFIFVFGDRSII